MNHIDTGLGTWRGVLQIVLHIHYNPALCLVLEKQDEFTQQIVLHTHYNPALCLVLEKQDE